MSGEVIARGNTVAFSFVFYDSTGAIASPDSAKLYITFVGYDGYQNAAEITLTQSGDNWTGSWNSSAAKGGWVDFHGHAVAGDTVFTQDGRFKLSANRANLQHDRLSGATTGNDYAE